MKDVEYLTGSKELKGAPLMPFAPAACDFLHGLSQALMKTGRNYPDVLSFAYWCRKGNIEKLKENWPERHHRLGRGIAFHIAPANIPVNFAFSFVFSLLAGNGNIVRVPSKPFPQIEIICRAVNELLPEYPELNGYQQFIRYPSRLGEITAAFSRQADIRIIWGGDQTIADLRQIPTKPRCLDICFADRYSAAILNGNAILALDEKGLSRLAGQFYNDTFLMDQNACSSPQVIFWQNDSQKARQIFWRAVSSLARERYQMQGAVAIDKYTQMFEDAIERPEIKSISFKDGFLYRLELASLEKDLEALRGKGGYFYEYPLESLRELEEVVTDKFQTITCFGTDAQTLREFILKSRLPGVDRIVPVGQAMNIGLFWDGFDLISTLSRYVDIG